MPGPQGSPQTDAYWSQPVEALLASQGSRAEGLTAAEASQRLAQGGPNALAVSRPPTAFGLFIRQLNTPIIIILLVAAGISAVLQDWPDALIIALIILGSATLSTIEEYSAGNAAQKLRERLTVKATVLRDDQSIAIPAEQVVPGDVVLLSAGSLIPADGVLLEARDFFVSEAVLTGETYPVEKRPGVVPAAVGLADRTNCVFMGTSVRSGTARALMVQTGPRTVFGQVAARLTLRPPETEFERGIRSLGYLLSEMTLILVFAVFAVNIIFHKPLLDSLLFSLALAVGLTPQLLPAIININLSRGSLAMAKAGVIVRRLSAIENFGSMDVLCTDKTGTLTVGVVKLDRVVDAEGADSPTVWRYAYLNASLQSGLANPLDEAIAASGHPDGAGVEKIDEIPYDFVRKRLTVVVHEQGDRTPAGTAATTMITKGALEPILDICTQVQTAGSAAPLDAGRRAAIEGLYAGWSEQGFRVLGVAIKPDVARTATYTREDECDMTYMGALLFFDPPKPDAAAVLSDLARMGVQVKIITGDNRLVAQHAAAGVGLAVTGVITGDQLQTLKDEALWHLAEQANLFAEVDPNQKERIILALKKSRHVVGYMGDGINDAPALHAADVGISVDSAVDVAKEAAEFVLMKQDLGVLRQGISEGRRTFGNTMKYAFMATSANFGNMFSVAGASLFLPFLPMLPKQILLINFLTDVPEMTIAGDNVDPVFIEQPHRWDIGFIRRFMLVFGPLSSVFDFLTFGMLYLVLRASPELFHTGWFVESVLSATAVVFAVRTRLPFLRSRPSPAMLAATAGVALVTLWLPYSFLAGPLGFVPLPPALLAAIAVIVVLYFTSAEVAKRLFYQAEARRGR
jgi:P-type Mg2+ transporter